MTDHWSIGYDMDISRNTFTSYLVKYGFTIVDNTKTLVGQSKGQGKAIFGIKIGKKY